jgi:hypothetical protein
MNYSQLKLSTLKKFSFFGPPCMYQSHTYHILITLQDICFYLIFLDFSLQQLPYSTLRRHARLLVQSWSTEPDYECESVPSYGVSSDASALFNSDIVNANIGDCTLASSTETQKLPQYSSGCLSDYHEECSNFENVLIGHNSAVSHYNYDKEDGKYFNDFNDSDVECEDGDEQQETLFTQLSCWCTEEKVTYTAVDKLLKLLHPHHPDLPLTARTLLNSGQHSFVIRKIGIDAYIHFGLKYNLLKLGGELSNISSDILQLQVNIDGLPLFRSSPVQLWPILGRVVGMGSPFLIGVFCGKSKPTDIDSFLQDFIAEVIQLHDEGLGINGVQFRVQVLCFICDAPARSYLKQTKSHTGYYGCERCCQKGLYLDNRMTFPLLFSEKRTDDKFSSSAYPEHQTQKSPLLMLNIGLVSGFVLDYMHLACLGIVRRILFTWMKGPLKVRLSARNVNIISQKLVAMRGYTPVEFNRKPRSLSELEHWKATELRQFVLYTAPVVLKSQLKKKVYQHFLCLSVILHLLLSPTLCQYYCDYAEKLILC